MGVLRFADVFPLFSPSWFKWSPAIFILWAPAGFRATCYYLRKAYYRAFFQDPPGCAVGEESREYRGETAFPFILQNLHRYFLYLAILLVINHWIDLYWAFTVEGPKTYHVGLGTVVLLADTILLTLYTGSCHAWRHLMGGKEDCFSASRPGAGSPNSTRSTGCGAGFRFLRWASRTFTSAWWPWACGTTYDCFNREGTQKESDS